MTEHSFRQSGAAAPFNRRKCRETAQRRAVHGTGFARIPACCQSCGGRSEEHATRGEVLVRKNRSRCHAIGKTGESPHPEAPPFRILSSKYPLEDLSESLAGLALRPLVATSPPRAIFDVHSDPDISRIAPPSTGTQPRTRGNQ